jgi:hypothetical protein
VVSSVVTIRSAGEPSPKVAATSATIANPGPQKVSMVSYRRRRPAMPKVTTTPATVTAAVTSRVAPRGITTTP